MALIPFPDVPKLPGVPALPRSAKFPPIVRAGLGLLQGMLWRIFQVQTRWGICDSKGKPLGRRIRQSEISDVNGYNTYAMTGLPKGPIANPSRAAIAAVLNPQATSALFFVADGKGGHVFADTLQQHNANVKKWYAIRRERGEM